MSAANITESSSIKSMQHNVTKQSDVSLTYRVANLMDCESVSLLVNSSSRGNSSHQGWTSADAFVGGQRIDIQVLTDIINDNANIILVFFEHTGNILVGCVHLQHNPTVKSTYLGMLTVRPDLQTQGHGTFILSTAENYAVNNWNVDYLEMTVITERKELIAYYNRRGYVDTGRRKPFPVHDSKFGIPKKANLEFCILEKCVNKT